MALGRGLGCLRRRREQLQLGLGDLLRRHCRQLLGLRRLLARRFPRRLCARSLPGGALALAPLATNAPLVIIVVTIVRAIVLALAVGPAAIVVVTHPSSRIGRRGERTQCNADSRG
jgi:hypothetical protein